MARMICIISGCERIRKGNGYCSLHYDRIRLNGSPFRESKSNYIEAGVGHIQLTRDAYALCDAEDFNRLNQWKWQVDAYGYAYRSYRRHGKKVTVWMHRLVNNTPPDMITDHINHNKSDNRKCNLRTVNESRNAMNSKTRRDNSSGYRGVHWNNEKKKWVAKICKDGKVKHLGAFVSLDEAAHIRKKAEQQTFKEFSYGL